MHTKGKCQSIEPGWKVSKASCKNARICSTGTEYDGSGFCITEPVEDCTAQSAASFTLDDEDQQTEDPISSSLVRNLSGSNADSNPYEDNDSKSHQQNPAIVNCWGPIFCKGNIVYLAWSQSCT